jgi:hypothetical protein
MDHKQFYVIFFTVLCMPNVVSATHFRGSMISWRILNASSLSHIVEILQRHAWRYGYCTPLCTAATISNG